MTKEEKYAYWLELAQYDLDAAASMFSAGCWFYVVFMCQQAVEKCCKGLYTLYLDDNVPKIHNIKPLFPVLRKNCRALSVRIHCVFLIIFPRITSPIVTLILKINRTEVQVKVMRSRYCKKPERCSHGC